MTNAAKHVADCFAYDRALIPVADAQTRLREHALPVTDVETVPVGEAMGRVLAVDVRSPRDIPGFDNAAVDGWAFAWTPENGDAPRQLRIVAGRAAAGHPFDSAVPPGACLRILTGAVMPEGADSIALQEAVRVEGEVAWIPAGLARHANTRPAGEDMAAGAIVLAKGHRLRAQDVGALALMGMPTVEVYGLLRVAIFSTGDELLEPGMPPIAGRIFDANRFILAALMQSLPVKLVDLGRLPDDREHVEQALGDAALHHDLVVTSGGASQGDEDHVARVLDARGAIHFWRIALKPGRPLAFGRIGQALFIGLPGNPVAASVCFALFGRPLLLALAGQPWATVPTPLVEAGFAMTKHAGRTELIRVRLETADNGPVAHKVTKQGSGVLTSLVEASGLLEVGPEIERIEPGMRLPYRDFASLGLT